MAIIKKKYHFYAAHRNELLDDKCKNLHGHVYRFWVYVSAEKQANGVTILFNDIDKYVNDIISIFDHSTIVSESDVLLKQSMEILKTKVAFLPYASSAENLAYYIFTYLKQIGLPIVKIELMETESSTVIYEP